KPRPPPGGCCPKKYIRQCCPVTGDNETIYPCEKQPISSRPGSGVPTINPKTACVYSWLTQACAGGFYLDGRSHAPKACPK
ncbi:Hypothetical predicted protein, partial [Paramuricea clavata]